MSKKETKKITPRFDYPAWVRSLANVTKTAKLLYEELINCSGGIGTCWPSIRTLAKKLNCCKQSVIAATKSLQTMNLIQKYRRYDPATRSYTSNLYQILPIPEVDNPSPKSAPEYEFDPVPEFPLDLEAEMVPEPEPAPEPKPAKKPFWKSAKKSKPVTEEEQAFLDKCRKKDRDHLLEIFREDPQKAEEKRIRYEMLQSLYIN